jgi:outer membrane lipoprotein-sorting protein
MQVIYPRLKRVEKYPLAGEKMGQWKDTLALLEAGFPRSEADLERQFKVLSLNTSNAICHLALEPKSAAARRMMPRITIDFATNNFALAATELLFGDGSVMRNDFQNGQTNPAIAPSLFAPPIDPAFKVVEPMAGK